MEESKSKFIIVETPDFFNYGSVDDSKKIVINCEHIISVTPKENHIVIKLSDGSMFETFSKLEDYIEILNPIVIKKSGSFNNFNFEKNTI